MSKEIVLTLPKLYKEQLEIRRNPARFKVVCCGRRFGKDVLGLDAATETGLKGYPVGWFSPTYKTMLEVWRTLEMYLTPVIKRISIQEKRLELITGGVIELWSLDETDSGRGRKYKRVIVNEAAIVKRLGDAWQQAIRPTLADLEGDAYFLSTPKGNNFFRTVFNWGMDTLGYPEWQSWQMPTSTNPYIKASEIEAARQELPERIFEQEYLAHFMEDAGGVFRGVRTSATLERVKEYYPHGKFVAGVDWGKENDFTVIAVFDVATRRMVDLDRFNKIDWAFQYERLKTVADKWQLESMLVERNSIGNPGLEALVRMGLPAIGFDTTPSSKPPLIESWALAIERHEVELLNDPVLISEHESYERQTSEITGRSRYSAPEGMHDDTVIASALGYKAALQCHQNLGDLAAFLSEFTGN